LGHKNFCFERIAFLYPVLDGVNHLILAGDLWQEQKFWSWVLGYQILVLGSALIGEEARSIVGNPSVIPILERSPASLG
jgi:hypothetical protein